RAGDMAARPLWPAENPLASDWAKLKDEIEAAPDAADWAFWVRWYEDALAGRLYRPEKEALLTEIALRPDEEWEKGAGHVAGVIEDIRLRHAIAASPNAERIVYDEPARVFRAEPVSDLPEDRLDYAYQKASSALKVIDAPPADNDPYGGLEQEREILRGVLTRNAPAARELYDVASRVARRVRLKISRGDCPEPHADANIDDFLSQMDEVALDLLADGEVRNMVSHRAAMRLEAEGPEVASSILLLTEDMRVVMDDDLATEMSSDAAIIADPAADQEDRREAQYRHHSRFVRIYHQAKTIGREVNAGVAGVAEVFKNIGVIVKNAAYAAIAWEFILYVLA
ncbi:MAG: hypothetical protein ACK5MQ_09315, partial [Pikeienuella sp.]